jgi:hypothetical protein
LVKRGDLEVLHRFSIPRAGGKTAPFLREEFSISLSELDFVQFSGSNTRRRPSDSVQRVGFLEHLDYEQTPTTG